MKTLLKYQHLFVALFIMVACFMCAAMPVFAADPGFDPAKDVCNETNVDSVACQQQGTNTLTGPDGIITKVIRLVALVTGVAAVFMIIISGLMYVAAGGDSARISKAKNTLFYAVIGLVIAALAQGIVAFVIGRL